MPGQPRVSDIETIPTDDVASPSPPPAPLSALDRAALSSNGGSSDEPKRGRSAKPKAAKEPKRAKSSARTTKVVLRKLDAWSVLKLSLVFYLALLIVVLVAGVLLWAGATAVGVVGNIESFMVDIGFNDFKFVPKELLGGVALGGLVLVVAGTCANVLLAALFNLMGDIVGGLKLTLQEENEVPLRTKDDGKATV